MPSSTSSSDDSNPTERRHPLPAGLRLTASDRPGVAQPVPERDVPDRPWRAMFLAALLVVAALTAVWEWQLRRLELVPGDLNQIPNQWAEMRHRIDTEPVPVAIVGDSRILFDTDLGRFQELTGIRPLQLALIGTNGLPVLEGLADDPKFTGLAIVGMVEFQYFDKRTGMMQEALKLGHWESPAKRASFLIRRQLGRGLAMLDIDYRLSALVARLDHDIRPGIDDAPYHDVWKVEESFEDGQTWLWRRLEHDKRLSDHAHQVWTEFYNGTPIRPDVVALTLSRTKAAVDKIRRRGGDVVFVRPPSAPELRRSEEKSLPKSRGWDALMAFSEAKGVHIDDLAAAQGLRLPEGSHLSRACARVFTDAYVRRLAGMTPLLSVPSTAPPALSARDCDPPT